MRNLRNILLWSGAGLILVLIVGIVAVRYAWDAYLHSPSFRTKIGNATAHALRAEGSFMPFQFSGTTAYTDGFEARGADDAFFSTLRADQIRADLNWRGLLRRAWQLDELTIGKLDVRLPESPLPIKAAASDGTAAVEPPPKPESGGWKVDLQQARVRDSHFRWGGSGRSAGEVTGVALLCKPAGNGWNIEAAGGRFVQSGWPALEIDSARLRYQLGTLFITESTLRSGKGSIALSGEINMDRGSEIRAALMDMDIAPFLAADWRARITGRLDSDVAIRMPAGGSGARPTVTGSARLAEGQVTALPVLDQIAIFTQSQRFRTVALTKGTFDFMHDGTTFTARHMILESSGLLRIDGDFTIIDNQIQGDFQVGVTPASLQWLPGSRSRVFTTAREGYVWAPMRVSGPLKHPQEDLTSRLAAAAAGEVIEKTKSTILDTANSVLDLLR